jgi:hypothetical protein
VSECVLFLKKKKKNKKSCKKGIAQKPFWIPLFRLDWGVV